MNKSPFSPLLVNDIKSEFNNAGVVVNNFYDNTVKWENTQFQRGDQIRLLQFEMHNIFYLNGDITLVAQTLNFAGVFLYTADQVIDALNDPGAFGAGAFDREDDAAGNFLRFIFHPTANGDLIVTGTLQAAFGIYGTTGVLIGTDLNFDYRNSYCIRYAKLVCPQLNGAQIVNKQGVPQYRQGTLQIILPQQQQVHYFQKQNDIYFEVLNGGDFEFQLVDQDNRPICNTQYYLQVLGFFRGMEEVRKKKMAFLIFDGENGLQFDFIQNVKWLAVDDIYVAVPILNPLDPQLYTDLIVNSDGCKDSLQYIVAYQTFQSISNKAVFLWKSFTEGSVFTFWVNQKTYTILTGLTESATELQYMILKVFYLSE